MSECDGEQAARSVALEQAYVHEVYEQCAEKTAQSRQWPRIYKFLEELEPGALVCDIGCGNGKYLNFNNSIFKLGADRCKRLANIAREKENEVLICDNLALPFRDESFDAVLSIAVVHHFATTERRVNALKELARVLRIGGKLVISVWAMEQRHRKFESQDVLVPWPKAYCLNSTCNCETGLPCMNNVRRDHKTQKCILASKRIERQKNNKSKRYWIDPIFSPSPSTSSLSSPNETCYSFFRRALQKLAGGRRGGDTGSHNRRGFSESFHNNDCKNRCHHFEQDDGTDVDDIPIELRRLEDENIIINKPNDSLSVKSKSLGDIIEIQKLDLVRSRSSIPGLCSTITSEINLDEETMSQATISSYKPRLVKQKTHLIDDTCLEIHENTAIKEIIEDLPKIPIETISTTKLSEKRANVQKQSSMNEELMSMERLLERERVRCNIMKQASLNEEIICKRGSALENFKDSLSSGIATRHFQMLKSGLTNRIKQSTTSMEKVASISIKNGFVKILQGWTSTDSNNYNDNEHFDDPTKIDIEKNEKNSVQSSAITPTKKEPDIIERRLSKEDGSDSSKDSSLQSDTSVDSEDSFASVIYVPKKEAPQLIEITNSTKPCGYQLRTTSAPPSPRVKHPPDHHGPRIKLISISPLLKQFPATSKSLPPPSPPGLSPRTINSFNSRPFFGPNYQNNIINQFDKFTNKQMETTTSIPLKIDEKSKINDVWLEEDKQLKTIECEHTENVQIVKSIPDEFNSNLKHEKITDITENITKKTNLDIFKGYKSMPIAANEREEVINTDDALTIISNSDIKYNSSTESVSDEDSRRTRLNQIKELLKQKPGFATRCTKPTFPLVRRASTANAGRLETVARTLPRLLSLELFNPETDDLDSDSSGVSSPESVGSVISVISDERFIVKKENLKKEEQREKLKNDNEQSTNDNSEETTSSTAEITSSSSSSQSFRLLEAAVNVASSLESAVETVIRVRTEPQEFNENPSKKDLLKSLSRNNNDDDNRWNEERKRHLIDFTEKLSENLINEIDQYCQKSCLEFSDSTIEVNNTPRTHKDMSVKAISNCKYNELVDNTIAWLRSSKGDNDFSENDNNLTKIEPLTEVTEITTNYGDESLCLSSSSEETIDFVMVSKNGEIEDRVKNTTNNSLINCSVEKCNIAKNNNKSFMKLGDSLESSDIGDSIDTTVSLSNDSSNTKRLCSASTASLGSINVDYNISVKDKRKYRYGRRSISEEIASDNRRFNEVKSDHFSESSSQESLPSDHGGGAITYHQYYHVFREGELDQLINKYVENLHIISSYYDHANWCIVAEKVQVWTI